MQSVFRSRGAVADLIQRAAVGAIEAATNRITVLRHDNTSYRVYVEAHIR
jgi:hypothetical protein